MGMNLLELPTAWWIFNKSKDSDGKITRCVCRTGFHCSGNPALETEDSSQVLSRKLNAHEWMIFKDINGETSHLICENRFILFVRSVKIGLKNPTPKYSWFLPCWLLNDLKSGLRSWAGDIYWLLAKAVLSLKIIVHSPGFYLKRNMHVCHFGQVLTTSLSTWSNWNWNSIIK